MFDVTDILILACAACMAGFTAGLLGVGGGMVMVPTLLLFHQSLGFAPDYIVHTAFATSLATVVPISITSALSHYRRGNLDLAIWRRWVVFVGLGGIVGGLIVRWFESRTLEVMFACLALLVAANLLRLRPVIIWSSPPRGLIWQGALPSLFGCLGAMFGIGGGTFNVPYLSAMSVPIHRAIGTAAGLGLGLAVPGVIGFALGEFTTPDLPAGQIGFISLLGVAVMAPLAVLVTPLGARLNSMIPARPLRVIFAVYISIVALRLLFF
ncbi:MAG: sulfite exporter TauE/SafE family protein [Pseudomonadota bacterium]